MFSINEKKGLLIIVMFCLVLVFSLYCLTGVCSDKRIVQDVLSREVHLEQEINSIITVFPPTTAMVLAIDGAINLKAVDSGSINNQVLKRIYSQFGSGDIVNIGHQFSGINKEEILSLDPDIIFASNWRREQTMEAYEDLFPIIYINVDNLDTFKDSFFHMGMALDKVERTNELLSIYEQRFKKVKQIADSIPLDNRPRVYMTSHGTFETCTKNSIESYILELCGGINVANNLDDEMSPGGLYPKIGIEQLLKWNPDIILVNSYCSPDTIDEFYKNPALEKINAIKNRKVYKMPDFISCWYIAVPESILGMEWTIHHLYPDKVDFDIKEEIKTFYNEFYGYKITEEEINRFFN